MCTDAFFLTYRIEPYVNIPKYTNENSALWNMDFKIVSLKARQQQNVSRKKQPEKDLKSLTKNYGKFFQTKGFSR